ncbi:hypothetical protein [Hufsiella ginkgonis]|uniref:Uncharacterized protein n=1 Tax=Hufsiella ginkgonis TaxID=2695274 RepID=A0A7K1XW73_9SPHI|nr:hypothetical protein [Hufsiella ginkgonis]MXV15029.1 hypothetical protein [Hufsiella ginkgonis]
MDKRVKQALTAGLKRFGNATQMDAGPLEQALITVFNSDLPFLEKVDALDAAFDDAPKASALREVYFDLLMINFFTEDVKKLEEDYLDSPEWEAIEEETLDRGTEILNVLLYLKECEDEQIAPSLEDYLKEFLLVDEDEFQDEYRIYEDVIDNQALMESSITEIAAAAQALPAESEMAELFYPVMSFFYEQKPTEQQIESYIRTSNDPGFDAAVYAVLLAFRN